MNGSSQALAMKENTVNTVLGRHDGRVETAAELDVLLQALVGIRRQQAERSSKRSFMPGIAVTVRTDAPPGVRNTAGLVEGKITTPSLLSVALFAKSDRGVLVDYPVPS